jgi:CRP/FNR family transcriptional regulator, cyclic AMP receptor protein
VRIHEDRRVETLSAVPLFSACSKKELRQIAKVADEIDLREGKVLTRQGGPSGEFFVLLEGTVDVERDGETINSLGPGDFFGELGLVSHQPRTATVTATSPILALVITETNFKRLLREDPHISEKVLEAVADRTPGES